MNTQRVSITTQVVSYRRATTSGCRTKQQQITIEMLLYRHMQQHQESKRFQCRTWFCKSHLTIQALQHDLATALYTVLSLAFQTCMVYKAHSFLFTIVKQFFVELLQRL